MKVSIPKISTKPFDIACTAYYMWAPVLRAYPLYLYRYKIGIILDILFSSNHNIHKSSFDFCFWASDPLIDRFYFKFFQLKGLKPKNKGHMNFYECCDLTKKYI